MAQVTGGYSDPSSLFGGGISAYSAVVEAADLDREADRIRQAGSLGRSGPLSRLFDHLIAAARDGVGRSEIDIATSVFGKPDTIDLAQDATARVYMHRLRAKLASYYDGEGQASAVRLTIPKGGYRIIMERSAPAVRKTAAAPAAPPRPAYYLWGLAAALVGLNLLVWLAVWPRQPAGELAYARTDPFWSTLIGDGRPLTIVVGDYYIFNEVDPARGTDRLVREYAINSPQELDDYLMSNPGKVEQYRDLGLTYLPAGVATALREIMPVLIRNDADRLRVRIVLASQLTPVTLRFTNVVYVGYLSGLGLLRDPLFSGSRLVAGSTWDELVDRSSGRRFVSDEGGPAHAAAHSRGYSYLARFTGPSGNHIVIVAGTRDMALMGAAEAATREGTLRAFARQTGGAVDGEGLFETDGLDRQALSEALVVGGRRSSNIWKAGLAAQTYPAG